MIFPGGKPFTKKCFATRKDFKGKWSAFLPTFKKISGGSSELEERDAIPSLHEKPSAGIVIAIVIQQGQRVTG